jgi:imidazoleglycerol-phosphate dehydratase
MSRVGRVERATKESKVLVEVDLDGTGVTDVGTGVGFFDHMLDQLGRHGCFDLTVHTEGDVHIDVHHTVEDTAIALGEAFRIALGDKVGIRRFGDAAVPLDETLVQAVVDLSGRPYLVHNEPAVMDTALINGNFPTTLVRHIWESFAHNARIALHVDVRSGRDPHHIVEAQFKAVARALRVATESDPRVGGVPSTKGVL